MKLSHDGINFAGAICGECSRRLDHEGHCTSRRCSYWTQRQDVPVPKEVLVEKERVVGNTRSRRAYRFGTPGYKRTLRSPNAEAFDDAAHARREGFEINDG